MKDLDEELIEPGSEFENDNGHTYHSYRPGQYLLPIDDNARYYEELLHNAVLHTCGNRLHYSPASANLEHVLDIGTGAGLWAIAMGQEYPKAKIDGFDLSPIQPAFIPPNVDFYVGDFTEEDPLTDRGPQYGYDLIHGRHLTMAVRDWPKLLATVLQDLKPGGFLELQELHLLPHLRGGQISHDTGTIGHFTMLLTEAFGNFGIDLHAPTALESLMKDAGYVEVTVECRNMPLSSKPASLDLDDAGNTMWYWLYFGADGLSNKPLREGLGWVEEKRQALLNELRETLEKQSRNEQILFRYYVVYGRKACE
ncbi:S-adenosyl-L-methionine-dependent methyltransferase [Lepidopterella palustris CBS 459.81]|uniref:S-adenosyl-L-methionine-dependent methyltransferase n=1 Tax=Lepidopterella palustris CBS 459.81 TaxID=1314670 RepID=A0A8E2JAR6_9PEZI|nr:S-adenosyl-L-methionine-dependent methyltransferase [Lepidopterella palustris CBS 459.81]